MTSAANVQIEDLIQLSERLTALVTRELAILKGSRPAALNVNDDERALSLALYTKRCAAFKRDAGSNAIGGEAKNRLTAATEKLRLALKEESQLLARFRHVTEGLVKAIADEVTSRQAPTTYAKAGSLAKPATAAASAMTFNQTI
jgi:hypothetical protein